MSEEIEARFCRLRVWALAALLGCASLAYDPQALAAHTIILSTWSGSSASRWSEVQPMGTKSASQIARMLSPLLLTSGFVKGGLRFYRYEEESILVIDVQPARYSPGPYINLGVYYIKYGEVDRPEITQCHLDTRLTSIIPNPLRGDEILDTPNEIPEDVRGKELQAMIRSYAIPWLEQMARFDDARRILADNPDAAHVYPVLRLELMGQKQ